MARLDVGEIVRTKIEFEWRIPDFFSLPEKVNGRISSQLFSFRGGKWYIELYPFGETANKSEGWIGIYLMRKDEEGSPRKVSYTFSIKSADGKLKGPKECTYTLPNEDEAGYGWYTFLKRSELINRKEELVPSDCLTIFFSLRMFSEPTASEHASSECSIHKLSRDLNGLLASGEDSDMVVLVKGTEFRLHRGIMGARTPVFHSMFRNEMREKATGTVSIEDCDADSFRAFVHYVYSGRVDQLCTDTVFELFVLADKYQTDELKSACLDFVKGSLSVDTFCEVVTLAVTFDEKELLKQATDFLAGNMIEVMQTVKWMNFLREHHIVANELMLKAVSMKK